VWLFFPKNLGLATGIALVGFGLGPFAFGFLMNFLLNPNTLPPNVPYGNTKYYPEEVCNNLPSTIRILVCCYFALTVIVILLIKPYKKENYDSRILMETT
jgi:hypothetical protein